MAVLSLILGYKILLSDTRRGLVDKMCRLSKTDGIQTSVDASDAEPVWLYTVKVSFVFVHG